MFSVYNIYRQSRAFYSYVSRFYSQHSKLGILDYLKTNDNLVLCFASSLVMISVSGCSVSFTLSFLKNATKTLCLSVSSETAYILHMVHPVSQFSRRCVQGTLHDTVQCTYSPFGLQRCLSIQVISSLFTLFGRLRLQNCLP